MTQDWLDQTDFEVPDRGQWLGWLALAVVAAVLITVRVVWL